MEKLTGYYSYRKTAPQPMGVTCSALQVHIED